MRDDILPLIIGGDISAYPMAREFHEEYGVSSVCIAPAPLAIIEKSRFIEVVNVPSMEADVLEREIARVAAGNAGKKVVLVANNDAAVNRIAAMEGAFPDNVLLSLPDRALVERVSDKIRFAELCAEHGLDAPVSQIVHVAPGAAFGPSSVPFPLVAKPAVSSAEYFKLYAKGFKKVYFIREQAELDQLWSDLCAEGYEGDFLVQELIGGDDTYVDMVTVYIDSSGRMTLAASAQVLLEDHAPSLFGNPVAMITRPKPELWEKVERMLAAIGWRGFANFDLKRDPQDGRAIFMDFNPRLGANSYYACAGGVNPMRALVDDLMGEAGGECARTHRNALYTRARPGLVRRYLRDEGLRAEFDAIVRRRDVANPMRYRRDTLAAQAIGLAMEINYDRKFARWYPEATDTSF